MIEFKFNIEWANSLDLTTGIMVPEEKISTVTSKIKFRVFNPSFRTLHNMLRRALAGFVGATAAAGCAMRAAPVSAESSEEKKEPQRLSRWLKGWSERYGTKPGFHKKEVNPYLLRHSKSLLDSSGGSSVLVPLCGKTIDMAWLAEQGHNVVGVEGVSIAIHQFSEESVCMKKSNSMPHLWVSKDTTKNIAILQADFLESSRELMSSIIGELTGSCPKQGPFDSIWDRAALVAIKPEDRPDYCKKQVSLLKPGGKILLSTVSYDQGKMKGPPFSVDESNVRNLYEPLGMHVKKVGSEPATDVGPGNGKFSALKYMNEMQFLLTKSDGLSLN